MSARRFRWSAKLAELDRVAFARARAERGSDRWPALGAQRRLEARIGQLLGEPEPGKRTDLQPLPREGEVAKNDACDFRTLARTLNGEVDLTAEAAR